VRVDADPLLAAQLGRNAHERPQRRHDPQAIGKATLGVYSDAVARHGEAES